MSKDIINPKKFEAAVGALASGYRKGLDKKADTPNTWTVWNYLLDDAWSDRPKMP